MADDILPQTLYETDDPAPEEQEGGETGITQEFLQQLMKDQKQFNADLVQRVVPPRGQPLQQDSVAPELEFSLEGLPDPQYDLKGFHAGFAARANAAVSKALQQTRQAVTNDTQQMLNRKDAVARADAMIKAADPSLDDETIAYAGGIIANRLKAQGKDPLSELEANTEAVAQEILDYTDDLRSKLGGARRGAEPTPSGGRTRGLLSPRARTPAPPRQREGAEDPKAFYKELTSFQQKARIY